MSFFGIGDTKSTSKLDPYTEALQRANYQGAQGINPNYNPTGPGLISQYMNPYMDDVVNATQNDVEHQRQMAINQTGDAATAAHAFGGSRHGVAEGITNGEYGRIGGLLTSQLRAGGFNTALGAAQNENQFQFQYPLLRQGLLNQSLAGVQGNRTQKKSGTSWGDIGNIAKGAAAIAMI